MNNEELLQAADSWLKYSVLYTKATDGASAALQSLAASLLVIARASATWQARMDEREARIAELNAQYNRNAPTFNSVDDFQKAHGGTRPRSEWASDSLNHLRDVAAGNDLPRP